MSEAQKAVSDKNGQIDSLKAIIMELIDALNDAFSDHLLTSIGREKLIKRAREAISDSTPKRYIQRG